MPQPLSSATTMMRFPRVFRRFETADRLFDSIVEGVADTAGVTRVGIFLKIRQGDRYRLRAGLRCLPETTDVEFDERYPLVRWLELHSHLIYRGHLGETTDHAQRHVMRRALDSPCVSP